MCRSRFCLAGRFLALAAAFGVLAEPTAAQTYPTRPLTLVTPYPAGGIADALSRAMAKGLSEELKQPVVVENKPGANQIIAAESVARSARDGYTLLYGTVTSLALNVSAKTKLPYDPVKDFAPVARCYTSPFYLVTANSLPVQSLKELIELARKRPGELFHGSMGPGTSTHLAAELFKSMTGLSITHVPYKGSIQAMTDVIAGRIQMTFDVGALPYARAGQVRVLAVTSEHRSKSAPDVPTMREAGLAGYEASIWGGVVVSAGTPRQIVDRLSQALGRILSQPAVQDQFRAQGAEAAPSTPEEFANLIVREIPKWREVMRNAKLAPDSF